MAGLCARNVAEIDRISSVTEFNSFNMLGADAGVYSMQVGKDAVAGIDTIDLTFEFRDRRTWLGILPLGPAPQLR